MVTLDGADLVVLTLPGIQRFISESRTTADLVSASTQVAALAGIAAGALRDLGAEVVIPAPTVVGAVQGPDSGGVPNRIVALVPAVGLDGQALGGGQAAELAVGAVRAEWDRWVRSVFGGQSPLTPGMPDPQWVCVPAAADGYREQFRIAQEALAARRRVRSFSAIPAEFGAGRALCAVSGRWPAMAKAPRPARAHELGETLGAVNWVKRVAAHQSGRPGTPSTFSIATAPYRAEVLARLGEPKIRAALMGLHSAGSALGLSERPVPGFVVPAGLVGDEAAAATWLAEAGGPWVKPDRWQGSIVADAVSEGAGSATVDVAADVAAGRRASQALQDAMGWAPGTHLAIVLQDLDDMGRFLSGLMPAADGHRCEVAPLAHAAVSRRLGEVARAQVREVTRLVDPMYGVPVYAGGDDLLMLAPAATAMRLARTVHDLVPGDLRTASTAVLFFSQQDSLQQAIRRAHELLDAAKTQVDGKHAVAVGYERRSGGAYCTVQPWLPASGVGVAEVFTGLAAEGAAGVRLSPRLISDLERDAAALGSLVEAQLDGKSLLRAEIRRLVMRHSDGSATDPAGDFAGEGPASAGETASALDAFVDLLVEVGRREGDRSGTDFDPVPAARVGVFLRQEAR